MAKFRHKTTLIEADQWFPGMEIPGITEKKPELIFSWDGEYYYLSAMGSGIHATAWLAVKPGKPKNGDVLPFVFWKVKPGIHRPAIKGETLTERYLEYLNLDHLPESYAIIDTPEGKMIINSGDWIIRKKVELSCCKPDIFEVTYEAIPETDDNVVETRKAR